MSRYYLTLDANGKIVQWHNLTRPENAELISVPSGCVLVEAARPPQGVENHYANGVFSYVEPPPPEQPVPIEPTLDELKAAKVIDATSLRDQKINGGVTFNGVRFQTRPDDRENIAGAAQLAFMAIVVGAQPGDLRWNGGGRDFGWIAEDNGVVEMDAPTVIAFAKTTAAFKEACIFYARSLKDGIESTADKDALNSIDIAVGWPQ